MTREEEESTILRKEILKKVREFHGAAFNEVPFSPSETAVPVSGKTFDADELERLVDASLDFWLTTGRYAARLERELAAYVGVRFAFLCNSGSSANLLAISTLTSQSLEDRAMNVGVCYINTEARSGSLQGSAQAPRPRSGR